MARHLSRVLFATAKQSVFSHSNTTASVLRLSPSLSTRRRGFATSSSLMMEGCGLDHWLVFVERPLVIPARDQIIDSYIQTLAMVLDSEEEAMKKIYYVSTRSYFGASVTEEVAHQIDELPSVRWVLPDLNFDMRIKVFGGEPLASNMGAQPNPPPNPFGASNMGAQQGYAPNNPATYSPRGPPNNAPNYHYGPGPNNGRAPPPYQPGPNNINQDWGFGPGQNSGNYATNAWPNWSGFGPNMRHGPGQNNAPNYYYGPGPNNGGAPPLYQPGPNNFSQDWGFEPGQNSGNYATNAWPNWSSFGPNKGHGPCQINAPNYYYGPNNWGAPPPYQPGPNNINQDWGFGPGQKSDTE